MDARLHWLVRKSGGKKKEEKEKAQPSSIPPKTGARVVRGKKDGIQRRGGVHSIRIRPCDVPRHLAAKKEKGKKGRKEEEGGTRRTCRGWSLPRGVGTVCSRVGERVALWCGDVEGEGKGLRVRDSLQHCEHTPA